MALTLIRTYRPQETPSYFTALTVAEMVAGAPTIQEGDICLVKATNTLYLCTAPEEFQPIAGGGAIGKAFSGVYEDFRSGIGVATSATTAAVVLASGVTIHGHGIEETDSGVTVAMGLGGPVASVITSATTAKVAALSYGAATEPFDPATYGTLVVEAEVAMSAALTARAFFIGFAGTYADALDPIATGSTTTITLVQDDLHGLLMDASLTNADGLFFINNKANADASVATTATGVDTGVDFPAFGTYCKLRVEVDRAGNVKAYKDDVLLGVKAAGADTTVPLFATCYIESRASAIKTMLVKSFAVYRK